MHSAVPPERLIRALEWGRGASTSVPNALDRVASPQPRGDLLFALHETGVRLAIWSLRRPITDLGIFIHDPVIGFGGQKYVRPPHLFSRVTPGLAGIGSDSFDFAATRWNRVKASDSCWRSPVATCTKSRRVAAKHQKKFLGPRSRGESSPISVGCVRLPRRAPRVPGKMWDCKTSKMSQSPRAALNAFGLFAADEPLRDPHISKAHPRSIQPYLRRTSSIHVSMSSPGYFRAWSDT